MFTGNFFLRRVYLEMHHKLYGRPGHKRGWWDGILGVGTWGVGLERQREKYNRKVTVRDLLWLEEL